AARRLAHHDIVGLLRHGADHAPAAPLDRLARGVARERREGAGEDEGLAREGLRPGDRLGLGGHDSDVPEPVDQRAVGRVVEEGSDRARDRLADAVHLGQLGLGRLRDLLEAAEAGGEELRHALAHEADAGQRVGNRNGSAPAGRWAVTTRTTYGITSPARSMRTVSPTRTSFLRISSSLCRLTLRITTPASSTGRSLATGVRMPVLPTPTSIASITVDAWRPANLNAIAQRGWWVVDPRRRWCSSASTLTTTPSAS